MRISLLTTELRPGGAERCLGELAVGFHRHGDEVRVLSLAPLPAAPQREVVDALRGAGIEVVSAGLSGWRRFPSSLAVVGRWLEAGNPEIVQSFLYHANVATGLALRKRSRRGFDPLFVAGVRVAEPRRGRIWAESFLARRLDAVVCVSRGVEDFVRRRWRLDRHTEITSIGNGVRVERFIEGAQSSEGQSAALRAGLGAQGSLVLFLGRLHEQKGIDLLLASLPALYARLPQTRVVIAGEGPLTSQVERAVKEFGTDRLVRLPWQQNVQALYRAADVILLPSRYEGMPNVLLEAMAACRPVLAAGVEGVDEILGPSAIDQSFPRGDQGSMIEKLAGLLERKDLQSLGAANRQRVLEHFTIDAMVAKYRAFYQHLLARAATKS